VEAGLQARYRHAGAAGVGALLGVIAWWQTGDWRWLFGGAIILLNWPYTFLVIMPVNNALLALDQTGNDPRCRALIEQWGRLHAGRTALGILATVIFVWASLRA
jgi:hypothetical protein